MDLLHFGADVGTAFVLGLIIGLEREVRHHEAGVRTHTLVCLGAALFVSLARLVSPEDTAHRIAAQVVSGVGFLAGGVILRDGFSVRGLNNAATIWCVAAIGTLAGAGYLIPAALGAGGVLLLHMLLRPATMRFDTWVQSHMHGEASYRLRVMCHARAENAVRTQILEAVRARPTFRVLALRGQAAERLGERSVVAELHTAAADDAFVEGLSASLSAPEAVLGAGWERVNGH